MKTIFLFVMAAACLSFGQTTQIDMSQQKGIVPVVNGGTGTTTALEIVVTSPAYGAICNGSGDDTVAFQAAVTAQHASGGSILVPDNKNCVINRVALSGGEHIHGNNYDRVIGSTVTAKVDAAFVTSDPTTFISDPIEIDHLYLKGGSNLIDLALAHASNFHDLTLENYTGCGITVVQGERPLYNNITSLHTGVNGFATLCWADASKSLFSATIPSPSGPGYYIDRAEVHSIKELGTLNTGSFSEQWLIWDGNILSNTNGSNWVCFFSCTTGFVNTPVIQNSTLNTLVTDVVGTAIAPEAIGFNISSACFNSHIIQYNPGFSLNYMTTQMYLGFTQFCSIENSQFSSNVDNSTTFGLKLYAGPGQNIKLDGVRGGVYSSSTTVNGEVAVINSILSPSTLLNGADTEQANGDKYVNLFGSYNTGVPYTGTYHIRRNTGGGTFEDLMAMNSAGTTFAHPITVPSCTGCGGGGGTATKVCSQVAIAMPTSLIASGAKSSTATGTCTGLTTSDNFSCSFAADPSGTTGFVPATTGILTVIPFVSANTINVLYENNTGSSITPGAETVHCSAWR